MLPQMHPPPPSSSAFNHFRPFPHFFAGGGLVAPPYGQTCELKKSSASYGSHGQLRSSCMVYPRERSCPRPEYRTATNVRVRFLGFRTGVFFYDGEVKSKTCQTWFQVANMEMGCTSVLVALFT